MCQYKLIYLATPYTHKDSRVRRRRYQTVTKITIDLLKKGIFIFSPITYNHPMSRRNLPIIWKFWRPYDLAFLERCTSLWVLKIDGWEESVGVNAEIRHARKLGIPIKYLTLEEALSYEPTEDEIQAK